MSTRLTRRSVLQSAGAAGIGVWVAGGATAAPGRSPNERINLAVVGCGGRGGFHIGFCGKGKTTDRRLIAVCDCDRRKVARCVEQMPGVKGFTDFRRMLDELGKDLDAVTVATAPDNNHANPALWAMARGKHVYLEKPMAMTVGEYSIATIGNFHNHWVDPAYMALDLKYPATVEAIGRKTDPLLDPTTSVRYTFAARGDQPAVAVTWHGAGTNPAAEMLEGVTPTAAGKFAYQVLFVGDKGRMAAGFSEEPQLLPQAQFKDVKLPEPEKRLLPHWMLWFDGIRNNTRCECDFNDYAQYLGEGAPLGLVAFWAGGKIDWDGPNMKAANCPEADAWLTREFRKEWKPC